MSSDPLLPPGSEPEPTIPSQSVPPVPDTSVTPVVSTELSSTSLAPTVAAGISVLTSGIGGVVFLILEKRDPFVRFWAMQSIFFGVGVIVLNIAVMVVLGILGHILGFLVVLFWMLARLGLFVLWVFMLVKSFTGKEWEAPVIGKLAREQLARSPRL